MNGCKDINSTLPLTQKRLDELASAMRNAGFIIAIYCLCFVALIGLAALVIYMILMLRSTWKGLVNDVKPLVYIPGTTSMSDDEIYSTTPLGATGIVQKGAMISKGMNELRSKYDKYNKQITEYSKNVLKEAPDDLFDKNVLDRGFDDFK